MKTAMRTICAAVLALAASAAQAQNTLGEVLDGGGRKMDKPALSALVSGATMRGQNKSGGTFEAAFKADGSYTGSVRSVAGGNGGVFGTWKVEDDGQFCVNFTSTLTSRRDSNCTFMYQMGDRYFTAESETDRASIVRARTFSR